MPDTGIGVSSDGTATWIRLARPPVNALDAPMIEALREAFETADPARPVILTGDGQAFSAGVDTRAFAGYSPAGKAGMVRAITRMTAAIVSHPAPVIAAVNGHALGGGFVLMLCTDVRLIRDDDGVKYGLTEARAGVPFPAGPLAIIRHHVPQGLLRKMTLTSHVIGRDDLLSASLADRAVPAEDLATAARTAAHDTASQPAFRQVKQQMLGDLAGKLHALAQTGSDPLADYLAGAS